MKRYMSLYREEREKRIYFLQFSCFPACTAFGKDGKSNFQNPSSTTVASVGPAEQQNCSIIHHEINYYKYMNIVN